MAASHRSMPARLLALGPWLLRVTVASQALAMVLSLTVRAADRHRD